MAIIWKNRQTITKHLKLTVDQCRPQILFLHRDGKMLTCRSQKMLKNLGMKGGRSYQLVAAFSRVNAFLTPS